MKTAWSEGRLRHALAANNPFVAPARPTLAISAVECAVCDDEHHEGAGAGCRYQVAWAINPHMTVGAVDYESARSQHAVLAAALAGAGAELEPLPFVHGAFDSVFVKDPALLLARRGRRRALLARFRHPERAAERTARARYYEAVGYEVVTDDAAPHWEGGDIVMQPTGAAMFLGHGFRSNRAAAAWLERHAGVPVHPVELTDPHLYHLDMALAILPDGLTIVCPWAITPASLQLVERVQGPGRVMRVPRELALGFGLNLVSVADTLVLGASDRRLADRLTALGYRCVVVPLHQFHLAGGSAACLVAAVHPDPLDQG